MESSRKRILMMLENGSITTDEALTLLENLGKSDGKTEEQSAPAPEVEKPQNNTEDQSTEQKETEENKESRSKSAQKDDEPSMDEFLEDLRKDFSNVGDRFMQFMQTAVQKVKTFEFDSPFGNTVTFNHSITKEADGVEELIFDIDNGKVNVHCGDEKEIRADFTVKAHNSDSEEAAKKEFIEKILFVTDGDKLRVASNTKMTQVQLDLYIPRKKYVKLSARLLNGSFNIKDAEVEKIRVRTANGKIDISKLAFKDGEFETANGAIGLHDITGEKVEAETLNGRVYIEGNVNEVEAQSLSGHVVVTTTHSAPEKIEAKSMSGSVEIYIPSDISLSGEIASNFGRLDLQLKDVDQTASEEQLLQKSIRFKKDVKDGATPLHIFGGAKTGSVLVCYNAKEN